MVLCIDLTTDSVICSCQDAHKTFCYGKAAVSWLIKLIIACSLVLPDLFSAFVVVVVVLFFKLSLDGRLLEAGTGVLHLLQAAGKCPDALRPPGLGDCHVHAHGCCSIDDYRSSSRGSV